MSVNNREAQAFLNRARGAERSVGALLERRQRCREMAVLRGSRPEPLAALEGELDRKIGDFAALTREVEAVIDAVEPSAGREVLRYRYLNGWDWKRIAAAMGRGRTQVFRVHEAALNEVKIRLNPARAD